MSPTTLSQKRGRMVVKHISAWVENHSVSSQSIRKLRVLIIGLWKALIKTPVSINTSVLNAAE